MPVESAADRLMFLAAADFGCVVTYTAFGGAAVPNIAGIFDNDFLSVEDSDNSAANYSRSPRFTCRSADLVGDGAEGDMIVITSAPSQPELVGRSYRCTVPHADGTGMAVLWLERVT